jgi:SAM-dependent methyltransferase
VKGLADAYTQGASAWVDGPSLVYGPLADRLVEFSPTSLAGRSVLDLGSGTGLGSRAALAAGASVVATDLAPGMLMIDRDDRPPAAAGDALALPFRDRAFDVVLAPFSLNHLPDAVAGVREAGRVGSLLLASAYADDDDHPATAAVEAALVELGWERPDWYAMLRTAMHAWGTVLAAATAVISGGLHLARVEKLEIEFPELGPRDLVGWRMGMAQHTPFLEGLSAEARAGAAARAVELLGIDPPLLVRRVIFVAALSDRAR